VWLLLGRNPDSTATVATSKTEAAVKTATVSPPVAPEDASADVGVSTPKPVALAALLDTSIGQATSDAAWARLFELWGAKFAAGGNACLQASRQLRLGCLTQRGTLAQLRLLNRPAVLEIVDRAGVRQFLVLRSIENEHVGVDIGTRSERVSIAELSQVWYGDYSALWQSPAGTQPLSFGMRDARVQLLRQSLQRVAGTNSTTPGSLLYDAALARQVRQFQQQQRLNPDGVAGLQTLLALDAALGGEDPPRLLPSKSG
jgi:general secretion pathway protein A